MRLAAEIVFVFISAFLVHFMQSEIDAWKRQYDELAEQADKWYKKARWLAKDLAHLQGFETRGGNSHDRRLARRRRERAEKLRTV